MDEPEYMDYDAALAQMLAMDTEQFERLPVTIRFVEEVWLEAKDIRDGYETLTVH